MENGGNKVKIKFRFIVGITGTIAAIATGIYASWKWHTIYQNHKNLKKKIEVIPYEIERTKIV